MRDSIVYITLLLNYLDSQPKKELFRPIPRFSHLYKLFLEGPFIKDHGSDSKRKNLLNLFIRFGDLKMNENI